MGGEEPEEELQDLPGGLVQAAVLVEEIPLPLGEEERLGMFHTGGGEVGHRQVVVGEILERHMEKGAELLHGVQGGGPGLA